ncbi:MAG TPA: hypothetical protein VNN09_08830, partial [Candidatus Competibacteraceae bacterium]|nr:hypothetical protein [Candidatus Competibacteraceae bacterium]
MKRVLGYALVGVLAYLIFLVLQFPATALFGLLAPPGLTLQARQVEDSALSGQARGLRLGDGEWGELAWRWQPAGLLGGRLEYRLQASDGSQSVEALAGIDWQRRWRVRELRG